jgi:Anti-sigma-K factor rskA
MNDEHVFDELPLLLSGEADRATVTSAAAHLRGCEDCCQELISAVVSHAALTSAARFAPELADSFPLAVADDPTVHEVELPDLSSMFAQVRSEATQSAAARDREPTRRVPARWLVAAAVVVTAGAGGGIAAIALSHGGTPSSRSVALSAFDKGTSAASMKLIDDHEMKLDAASLPALGSGQYYEVWLTDSARKTMAAVGQLNQNREGDFTVPPSVMNTFSAVEVSVQQTSSTGGYSGVSVLRGSYA